MDNVISLSTYRSVRSDVVGVELTTRETILDVLDRNGIVFIGGRNTLGKITALRLERAGLVRIEEHRRDGTSRVMLPCEFEPKTHEETSVWMLFKPGDWKGLSA